MIMFTWFFHFWATIRPQLQRRCVMRSVCTGLLGVMLAFGLVQASKADIISTVAGPWGFELLSPPEDLGTYGVAYHRGHVTVLKSKEEGTTTVLNGGLYQIDSCFDVFINISPDGGKSRQLKCPVQVQFTEIPGSAGSLDTEMLSMNLTGDMAC
jgi:hypothetical protein